MILGIEFGECMHILFLYISTWEGASPLFRLAYWIGYVLLFVDGSWGVVRNEGVDNCISDRQIEYGNPFSPVNRI